METEDGTIYAPFNRLCENLELDRMGQVQRIQRYEVLRDTQATLTIKTSGASWIIQCLPSQTKGVPSWHTMVMLPPPYHVGKDPQGCIVMMHPQ